ncbi:MAG: hypothetical protein IJ776_09855 [Paludibacteraceae bacterium]|nr:hypothetical protein [Paludibacteraceae bacterium]
MKRIVFTLFLMATFVCYANTKHPVSQSRDVFIPSSMLISQQELQNIMSNDSTCRSCIKKTDRSMSFVELNTPPIGNQGQLPSCSSWAIGYCAGSILKYAQCNNWAESYRSPSFLFNQSKTYNTPDNDCKNATERTPRVLSKSIMPGCCSWNLLPYDTTTCDSSVITHEMVLDAMMNRVKCTQIAFDNLVVNTLKSYLQHGYPIVVCQAVTPEFVEMWKDGGVWVENGDTAVNRGYHTTCIVGYNDNMHMFKVQNSWGTDGGDDGFYWVHYDLVEEGCFYLAFAIVKLSSLFIDGPDILCPIGEGTYKVGHVPQGASIRWSYEVIDYGSDPFSIHNDVYIEFVGDTTDTIISLTRIPSIPVFPPIDSIPPFIFDTTLLNGLNSSDYVYWIREPQFSLGIDTYSDAVIKLKATVSCGNSSYVLEKQITLLSEQDIDFTALGEVTNNTLRVQLASTNTEYSESDSINWVVKRSNGRIVHEATGQNTFFSPSVTDSYIVTLSDNSLCGQRIITDTLDITVPLNQPIFPHFSPESREIYTIEIWNPQIGIVSTETAHSENYDLATRHLPSGIYIVVIYCDNKIVKREKVIIM